MRVDPVASLIVWQKDTDAPTAELAVSEWTISLTRGQLVAVAEVVGAYLDNNEGDK